MNYKKLENNKERNIINKKLKKEMSSDCKKSKKRNRRKRKQKRKKLKVALLRVR